MREALFPCFPEIAQDMLRLFRSTREHYVKFALRTLGEVAAEAERTLEGKCVSEQRQILQQIVPTLEDKFLLVLIGRFSTGKSTLLNAFLGEQFVPSTIRPTNAMHSIFRYAEEDAAWIHYMDGHTEPLAINDYPTFIQKREDEVLRRRVDHVEVQLWREALRHVDIVDTPGLNDFKRSDEVIAKRFFERADGVLWLVSYQHIGSREDERMMAKMPPDTPILGVITYIDTATAPREQAEMQAVKEAERYFGNRVPVWFPLSARKALEGVLSGDHEIVEQSGLPRLQRGLSQLVYTRTRRLKLTAKGSVVRATLDESLNNLEQEVAALKADLATLDAAWADLTKLRDTTLREAEEMAQRAVDNWVKAVQQRVNLQMETLFEARFEPSRLRDLIITEVIKATDLPQNVNQARWAAYDIALAKWQLFCREREISWQGEPGRFSKDVSLPDAENEIMQGLRLEWGKRPYGLLEGLGEWLKNLLGHPFRPAVSEHIHSKAEAVGRSASSIAAQGFLELFERWFKEVHALAERHFLDRWGGQRQPTEQRLASDWQCIERLRKLDTSLPERMSLRQLLREQIA